ncbi:MAG: amidohydrolase family protein [Verrucomicrobiae bacterium]|nr:amidohydrolase family protein [Verrucomicrobiae bacterium]
MKIDAHQHFWRYDAVEYPWIAAGSALERDWLPSDLAAVQGPLGFDGSIAVQARQSVEESEWLLGLAEADPRILGVVGWVDLRSERVGEELERLGRHPRWVGVRHVAQDEPDDRFLVGEDFVRGVSGLRERGLVYEILIYPRQLPAALELVGRLPEQAFVLDHAAKPCIREGTMEPWASQMRELGRHTNVSCKVSGLVTEADPRTWRPGELRPYLDVVAEAFGPERLMFGSDWPVCLLAAGYERVVEVVEEFVATWDGRQRAALFGGNAARVYGLASRGGPPDGGGVAAGGGEG